MQRWKLAFFVAVMVGVAGPALAQVRGFGLSEAGEQAGNEEAETPPAEWTIESAIADMSLRTRVSQLLMVTLQGRLAPEATERQLLENYTPGAVVISNLTRPRNAVDYAMALQGNPVRRKHGVPMLIGADLADLPVAFGMQKEDYFAPLPTMMAVAAADDPVATRELAGLYAEHLALMGFSFQMGPCLALAPDLPGAKGGLQCLGSDPAFVGEAAEIFVQSFAQRDLAVMFTGFPGGQWNQTESAPPMLFTPASIMPTRDLVPFKRAVMGGARILLVGNILVPHLDKKRAAASVSPTVMKELLREKLLYPGVVVAGPIDGLEVGTGATQGDAALAALRAGADMLFWRQPGIHVMKAAETIVQAVENGEFPESAINVSVTRVLQLKEDLGLRKKPLPDEKNVDKLEKRKSYPLAAQKIERRSITILRNSNNALPLVKGRSTPVGVTGVLGVEELHDILKKELKNVAQQRIATAKHGGEIYNFEIHRLTARAEGVRTVVIVLTNELRAQGKVELIREMKNIGAKVVIVLVGYPNTLGDFAEADAIVAAYCDPAASSAAMSAVAEALLGRSSLAVRPPVEKLLVKTGEPVPLDVAHWVRSPAGRLPVSLDPPYEQGVGVSLITTDTIKKLRWDFGDGASSKEKALGYAYTAPGHYTLTLSVTDDAGETDSGVAEVEVTE